VDNVIIGSHVNALDSWATNALKQIEQAEVAAYEFQFAPATCTSISAGFSREAVVLMELDA
jgi:hypothetical protein